ncbi:protein translocase subunit [Puccinia graminis f. sp. tritici]|uniref:Protein translocase subunit n=1 Tax=Puccinia graminis f. sp. tritici TaxID=56615 RepID=A0A5B0NHV6_PUCGR|nr:protein translocase subunit [Puccinia graminis f. sp. tritici]
MSFNSTRSRLSSIRRASNALIQQNSNRRDRLTRLAYSTNKQSSSSSSKQDKQDDNLPAGVSPWARFMDVLKSEYAKSQEIQENVRELTGTAQGIKDSEAAQKMRKAYTAMRLESLIKENPQLARMAKSLSSTGKSVSEAVNKAANEIEESRLIQTARRVTKELDRRIAEPIRQTEVYKVVEDTVDFSQGALRYGGYIEKEERIRRRQKRLDRLAKANPNSSIISAAKAGPLQNSSSSSSSSSPSSSASPSDAPPTPEESSSSTTVEGSQIAENPNAPPALVLHATANEEAAEDSSTIGSRMKGTLTGSGLREIWKNVQEGYAESENPVVASIRSVTGFLRRNLLDETETAKVIRLVKEVDPAFNYDAFLADLREFIIPDFVDSFVDNDLQALKMWTSEAAFNVTSAPMKMYLQRGLRPANQIIDLKGIDILSAKVLEERDLPVFIVAFKTHEINCYINPAKRVSAKSKSSTEEETGEEDGYTVEVGSREEIQVVQYVVVLTKDALLNASTSTTKEEEVDEDEELVNETDGPSKPHQKKPSSPGSSGLGPNQSAKDAKDAPDHSTITGGWKIIDLARRSSVAFL